MSCENNTNKYVEVVEDLIKLNPNTYKNFDNAAKFILKSQLDLEQKKLTINGFAHIYSMLSDLDPEFYVVGMSKEVTQSTHLLDDNASYVSHISELLSEEPVNLNFGVEALEQRLLSLENESMISPDDLKHLLIFIDNFFYTSSFETEKDREEYAEELKTRLKDTISRMGKVSKNPTFKESLFKIIDNSFAKMYTAKSEYISINNDVAKYTGLSNVIVQLKDGTIVEAVVDANAENPSALNKINPDGTHEAISPDDIVFTKPGRPTSKSRSNNGEEVFRKDELTSGFKFKAANPEENGMLQEALRKASSPESSIKFYAVAISPMSDARVQRMHNLANDEKQYARLRNRNHETFETVQQIKKLESNASARVLTSARPKASEQRFAIMGKINDITFYVYSVDSLVFLDADNTTTKVDFMNPDHIRQVQTLSLKETSDGGLVPLTNSDMVSMSNSVKLLNDLKESVSDKFENAFSQGKTSVEITSEFFDSYSVSSIRHKSEKKDLISKIQTDKSISLELPVVTVDGDGKIVSKDPKRRVPFVVTKDINGGVVSYSLTSLLASDELIEVTNEDGDVVHVTDVAYARSVLGYEQFLKKHFAEEDAQIEKGLEAQKDAEGKIRRIDYSKIRKTDNFVLRFDEKGNLVGHKILKPVKPLTKAPIFASYISQLASSLGKSTEVRSFDRQKFGFEGVIKGGDGSYTLSFNIATGMPSQGSKLQLEIRPYGGRKGDTTDPYNNAILGDILNANGTVTSQGKKYGFNFPLNETVIKQIFENLGKNEKVQEAVESNKSLAGFDLTTSEGLTNFYSAVYKIKATGTATKEIDALIDYVETDLMEQFNQEIMRAVVDPLKQGYINLGQGKRKQVANEEFFEIFRRDTTFNGEYKPEYLFFNVDSEGNLSPRIRVQSFNQNDNDWLAKSLSGFEVLSSTDKIVSIVPKNGPVVSVQDESKIDNYELKEEKPVDTGVTDSPVKVLSEEEDTALTSIAMAQNRLSQLSNDMLAIDNIIFEIQSELNALYSVPDVPQADIDDATQRYIRANQLKEKTQSDIQEVENYLAENKDIKAKKKRDTNDDYEEPPESESFKLTDTAFQGLDIISDSELLSEVEFLGTILPQFGVSTDKIQDIIDLAKIDGNVLGLFKNRVIYLNDQLKVKGVVFHEAFHGVFRYLLTREQREALINEVMRDPKHSDKFTQEALMEFARKRGFVYDINKMAELVAEEVLADGFQDYMNKKREKKSKTKSLEFGLLQMLFDLLDRLIQAFTRYQSEIDLVYDRVATGYYKTASIKSNLYDGQVAFELIDGPMVIKKQFGEISRQKYTLNMQDQNQLIDMVNGEILKDDSNRSFDQKFEDATTKLIETVYNLDLIINQNEKTKANALDIKEKYGNLLSTYRFMLGARLKGYNAFDLNFTGDSYHDGRVTKNIKKLTGVGDIDNTNGQYSYDTLKKHVKRKYDSTVAMDLVRSGDNIVDAEELEKIQGNESGKKTFDTDVNSAEQELEGNNYDVTVGVEASVIDSYVSQVRRFFSTVRRDIVDQETGAVVPRMIDGEHIFTSIIKVTSDLPVDMLVPSIKNAAERMMEDGFTDTALDFQAIYDEIQNSSRMIDGQATNEQLYNMLVNVFNNVELNWKMFNVTTPAPVSESEMMAPGYIPGNQQFRFRLTDKVLESSIRDKKEEIITNILIRHKNSAGTKEFRDAHKNLLEIIKDITVTSKGKVLTDVSPRKRLNTLTDDLHKNMSALGITVPKSLIKLSLMAIHENENKQPLTGLDKSQVEHYEINSNFVKQGQYLEEDFFRSLGDLLKMMYSGTNPDPKFRERLDDQTNIDSIKRFLVILKNASAYAVKYDPTIVHSTIRNAEGKSIYRFSKYNPMAMLAQRLKTLGLEQAFEDEMYYEGFVKDFFKDNPLLGKIVSGDETVEAKEVQLFLKNFDTSIFGGVLQIIGQDEYKDGKVFKDIDPKSLYILNILSFLERKTISGKDGTTIQTYDRTFHQLEATQTNFFVSALHKSFVSKDAVAEAGTSKDLRKREGKILYKDKYLLIVKNLEAAVRQEFNRIRREWSTREERKAGYESGTSNKNIRNYNAKLKADGTVDVESSDLRGYNFNKLSDFFDAVPDLRDKMIALAKGEGIVDIESGELVSAEVFEEMPEELLLELLDNLDIYADKTYKAHLQKLVTLGVVDKVVTESSVGAKPTITYESKLLPDYLKDSGIRTRSSKKKGVQFQDREVSLSEVYPASAGSNNVLESVLFDHFMNFWSNSLFVNELMDGDIAMNVKNPQDYVKRLKKVVASGDNLKEGVHKVAYINTIEAFIHDDHLDKGPYYSRSEILNDPTLSEDLREKLLDAYDSGNFRHETYDGQSHSLLMHQMDIFDSTGRLDQTSKDLMIAKHYRKLTKQEIDYLKSKKIVNNSKKTVTAGLNVYHKLSEAHIDRLDVSYIVMPENASRETKLKIYDDIHSLYTQIYDARSEMKQLVKMKAPAGEIQALETKISNLAKDVQAYFLPLPNREILHNLLNSMEYFNVDQIMDTSASKNATLLPVQVLSTEAVGANLTEDGYFNLQLSSVPVPNRTKYVQVETSGVKDYAKVSVQKKLLLPADVHPKDIIDVLQSEARRQGKPLTPSEIDAVNSLSQSFYKYRDTLNAVMNGRLNYFKTVLRKGTDIDVGKLYDVIREGLESQGAASSVVSFFATENGKPKFSPNLPVVRKTLEYYFMSQYSKNVTDEKAFGFKNFHESAFGYDIMEEIATGRVITTEEISKNASLYSDKTLYRTRPLGISEEVDPETGVTTYWVEAIIPAPSFKTPEQKQFWLEKINKMFGVRIPTEDKRSMIAIKVVDFIDESKSNNVIVPHFIHLLSGSDFDIDSLFGQMKAFYEDAAGNYHLYNDYSGYAEEDRDVAEFIEYMHFMQKEPELKDQIEQRKQKFIEEGVTFPEESQIDYILGVLGFTNEDLDFIAIKTDDTSYYDAISQRKRSLISIKKDIKEDFIEFKRKEKEGKLDRDAWKQKQNLGQILGDLNTEIQYMDRARMLLDAVYGYYATMQVLSENNLAGSIQEFKSNPEFSQMVTYKQQNMNLEATLEILTNEAVFKRLYINQRSSTEEFTRILGQFGLNLRKMTTKSNLYTIDNAIASKAENQMNKDGIGITAVMNKFLALASQYDFEINEENIIWKYTAANGNLVVKNKFAHINENDQRVIALIGNILGMFADGAKDPIPSALQWNEVNVNTTLSMIGVGLDPTMVAGFNFLPSIRRASQAVQHQRNALTVEIDQRFYTFATHVENELDSAVYESLASIGLITEDGALDTNSIIIDFTPQTLDKSKLEQNILTPSEIGFNMQVNDKARTPLTDAQMNYVLTSMYASQIYQSNRLTKAARMTNMFKRLNPTLTEIDALVEALWDVKGEDSIFTNASVDRMFAADSVYSTMEEMLVDLNEQASKMFLERSPFFRPLVAMFLDSFEDKRHIAETITSVVGIRKFITSFPGSRKSENKEVQKLIDQDDKNLKDTFTPDYWFTHNLGAEVDKFRSKYPNNTFLKYIRDEFGDASAVVMANDRDLIKKERVIRIFDNAKIKGSLAEAITHDLALLYNHPEDEDARMFVKRLFYHELARTGMISAKGSFLQYLPSDLLGPVSKGIDQFIETLSSVTEEIQSLDEKDSAKAKGMILQSVREFFDKDDMTNDDIYDFFDDLQIQLAYSLAVQDINGNAYVPQAGRLSWYYDKENLEKSSSIVKTVMQYGAETPAKAQSVVKSAITKMFGLEKGSLDSESVKSSSSYFLKPAIIGDTMNIDLSVEKKDSPQTFAASMEVARKIGVFFDDKSQMFKFPPLIKIGNTYYVYQGNEDASGDRNMGETLVNSLAERTNKMTILGKNAKYVAIPDQFTSELISPTGFTKQDAERHRKLVARKLRIDGGNNTKDPNQPVFSREKTSSPNVVYTAAFLSPKEMNEKYPTTLANRFAHHMTVSYRPDKLDVEVGEQTLIKVVGRLTTDKVDVLIVENEKSTNKFPHITLSTAPGVKPVESNSEIENNQDKIVPLNDNLKAIYGYYDGGTLDIVIEKADKPVAKQTQTKVQKAKDPRIPDYILNKDMRNADGSKRLASTNGSIISLNPVESVQELIDYMEGKEGGITSQQKKLVLAEMEKQGYGMDIIKDIITTSKIANMFLLLHEQDHIQNNDRDVYWTQGKDLNTPDKIAIETRASINALNILQDILQQPATQTSTSVKNFDKKNLFKVNPIQAADKKATIKASIATQYIGFGEGITGSSTENYRQQAGAFANTGNYSANDVIFVSIGGKRGTELQQKTQQDRTIKEAIKAVEAGATILTDNKAYTEASNYNTGEQRLYANMKAKGYNYSEVTVDGQVIGTWSKPTQPSTSVKSGDSTQYAPEGLPLIDRTNIPLTNDNAQDPGIGSAQHPSAIADEFEDLGGNVEGTDQEFKDTDAYLMGLMGEQVDEVESDKFEFTYKGVTIPTEFKLTKGQVVALKELIDFTENPSERTITLQGAAGTGKTAVIGYLQNYLKESRRRQNFIYMAPTHAATAELAFATVKTGNKKLPMTVQSAVRMAYNKVSKKEEAVFTKKAKDRMGFGGNIVVLDEVSMLSTKDYNTIIEASQNDLGNDIKIIFMGDIQQIPQVIPGSNLKKQVSKAFTEARQLKLTEVKRTDSNSILSVLTSMRENATGSVAGMIPQVENTESLKYLFGSEWNKEVVDSFTSNPEGSIFIAYQNSAVAATNQRLRGLFDREGDLQKGDVIVGYLGYSSKQIENQDIANSVRYTVDGITKVGSIIEIDASSSKLKQLVDAGVSGVEETATGKYYQLSMSDSFTFEDLTAEDFEKNNKSLSRQFKALYDAKQHAIKSKSSGAWRGYYATASEVSMFFSKALVGNDYIYNPETDKMEPLGSKTSHAQLKRNFPELVVEKSIDFGHAITIHKSQGTTVDNVFFDASTLPQASPKLLQGETVIGTERHSLAYVGISRASKKLIVESGNPSNFYPLDSQRSSQNVVKPKGRPGIDLNDKDNCG